MVDFLDTIMSIPKRYIIALLIAFSYGLTYLLYIVFDKSLDWLVTNNVSTLKDRYTISRTLGKSQLALMVGYLLTPVPGAFVVNRYGGVVVFGVTMILHGVFVLLVDNLTSINFFQLLTIRLLEGVLHSIRCSSSADVWARWSTQQDRSKYIFISSLGPQLIGLVYPYLVTLFSKNEIDLDQTFLRGTAIACVIWAVIWLLLCKNDPSEDKYLSDDERAILQPRLKYLDEKGVSWNRYPWQQMLKSKPLWALTGISFISGITNDQLSKNLPILMIITSFENDDAFSPILPGITKSVLVVASVLMAAYILDRSRNHSLYTTTMVHKFIICGGYMVQAILLLVIHFFSPKLQLFVILEALVTLASKIIEYDQRVNVLDLSLRYASLVNGIRCASYMMPRIFSNAFVITEKEEWLAFFIIISILYAIGALIYYIWGSGEVQPWNSTSSNNSNSTNVIWKSIEEDNERLID